MKKFLSIILSVFACSFCYGQNNPSAEELIRDLACGNCHLGINIKSNIYEKAPDLSQAGIRYNPDYIFNYMQYPVKVRKHIGNSRMPRFYLDEREALALTYYLEELIPPESERPAYSISKSFETIEAEYPEITAEDGKNLFYGLNCLGCHQQLSMEPWKEKISPDLSSEGNRVKKEWLRAFLKQPKPIRPFGFYPGTGARHPDFMLTETEVDTLLDFLMKQQSKSRSDLLAFEPQELSSYNMKKAQTLLEEKLSCLGCHQLGEKGGRIGPNLSSLKNRLQPDYVYRIVMDPKSFVAEATMPRVEMPASTANLIVNFLMQQEIPRDSTVYLSLLDNPPQFHEGLERSQSLYVNYCASCHGLQGNADGFNAKYLPVLPTKHADAAYMSNRPDDTLFDGVYAGGYILNKSHMMPPWGFTLEYEDIEKLVAYMRELCRCQGPAWSRDDLQQFRKENQ